MGKISPQEKAWKRHPRMGREAMLTGEFGESFVAYLLSKEGIDVVRASTEGFDLFAIDNIGKMFPKNRIIGISVKARISKRSKNYRPTIPVGSAKILKAKETWHIEPWVAVVVGSKDKTLDAFVFPHKDLPKLRGTAKREDVVAVSELHKNPTGKVVKLC